MRKIVVVLYGPPGAGKSTQANLLAEKIGLIHFNTGKLLESIVHDPKRQKEVVVRRERKLFDGGMLMTPSFVTREVVSAVKKISAADQGIIFSGSPRTLYEAEQEYPIFEKLYGKKNIFIFVLELPPPMSVKRNMARMICSSCGYLLITSSFGNKMPTRCPVCGGHFYKRTLDKRDVIAIRLKEYKDRTLPIIGFVKKKGYHVTRIDARPAPYKVMQKVYANIKKS